MAYIKLKKLAIVIVFLSKLRVNENTFEIFNVIGKLKKHYSSISIKFRYKKKGHLKKYYDKYNVSDYPVLRYYYTIIIFN